MTEESPRFYRAAWLLKQAEWRFAWDRRYFVQDGLRLAYRAEEKGPEKKNGYIASLLRNVGPQHSLTFRVWLKEGDCWTLRAETEEEHRQWTDSITAALVQDAVEGERDVREGVVLKKAAWTGEWRQRYFELDGTRMAYRASKEGVVRNRFIIVAADVAGEEGRECELLVTTSCSECFWMKFITAAQCNDWRGVIARGLRRTVPWHWQLLVSAHPLEYNPLHVQYHAAASGSGNVVYCYGGTKALATHRYVPATRTLLPDVRRESVERQLTRIRLAAEHVCTAVDVLPYEESEHAKLRPPPLFGAAICTVVVPPPPSLSSSSLTAGTSMPSSEYLLLVGGRGETTTVRDVAVEMWLCALHVPAPKWQRCQYDTTLLPHRTFHTLTARYPSMALLVGGMDDMNRVSADCFSIAWPADGVELFTSPPVVEFFGFLPEPRAFHACVALRDESLLVVGGRSVGNSSAAPALLRLASGVTEWNEVVADPPLPSLDHVCAAAAGGGCGEGEGEDLVFVLGETCNMCPTPRLFQLALQSPILAVAREIKLAVGAIPRHCCGATMHHAAGYLYVIGGCYYSNGNGMGGAVSFQNPVRMLIGGDSGSDADAATVGPPVPEIGGPA
ncbi:hypothetical protein DQ04_05381030 [Trypanosoma grayi]|uniref:hypothetical protein n=1 Tax=Trypanosoma grayi TaxID=71804 RepID=UPI0004F4951F|nr:hypothetical protein DQ04_05381030 [Trypanosoma grayi]KEG09340.1 hypothetical protein DQ04_05381030 [Trypanosoma grayi]